MGSITSIILECKPTAQYHFGEYSIDDTRLSHTSVYPFSDTIFSAIVNIYNDHFQNTNQFVKLFHENKIQISSGSYLLKGKRDTSNLYFLHKPIIQNVQGNDRLNFKKQKKISFVSKRIWEEGFNSDDFLSDKVVIIDNKFICYKNELSAIGLIEKSNLDSLQLSSVGITQRNHVSKAVQEGTLYSLANLQIQDLEQFGLSVHFYFLLKHDLPEEWKTKLDLVLSLLPEFGLGGERSTGCGKFWGVSTEEFKLNPLKPSATFMCSASLISPYNLEELNRVNYYSTLIRGGRRLGSDENAGYKLQQIRMIKEGALVKNDLPIGHNPSIKPQGSLEEYLRYGKGFLLPIHENWTKQWQG